MLKKILLLLLLLTFAAKLYYLGEIPLKEDGTLYAEMIAEEAERLTFLPTYFGHFAPWKPGTYFIAYSLFLPITSSLFNSIEWIYRFPNILFALLSTFLFYKIVKRFEGSDFALAASVLFYSSTLSFYVESRLLMEPFMLSLILCSLFFYTDKRWSYRSLFGGLFAFLASLTKAVVAFAIIPIAFAHALQKEKRLLRDPYFLLSFLSIPLGLLIFWHFLAQAGLAEDIFFIDIGKHAQATLMPVQSFYENLSLLFGFLHVLLMIGLAGAYLRWRDSWMFFAWLLLLIPLLLAFEGHVWYFYYILPAFAFFGTKTVMHGKRLDAFAVLLVSLIVLSSISIFAASAWEWRTHTEAGLHESREIGLSLSGKENVLFIGQYLTNTIALSYKTLDERKAGSYEDFGYIIMLDFGFSNNSEKVLQECIEDYAGCDYSFEEENFASLFWSTSPFRKKTPIHSFDYVVVSPPVELRSPHYSPHIVGNSTIVYKKN